MENLKIIIVISIFDRFENLKRWTHAWNQCEQLGAKVFFINNHFAGVDTLYWEEYCKERGVHYQIRPNIGYETGIIQDVITGALLKDEDWNVFFFMTDDTIPIKTSFLREYIEEVMKPDVGVACMQVSGIVTPHIRTTGWCIRREIAEKIVFSHTPVNEKFHCYHFEHLGGDMTLMAQILKMDKRVVQMSSLKDSSIWDTHHTDLYRWEEWHKEFPGYI